MVSKIKLENFLRLFDRTKDDYLDLSEISQDQLWELKGNQVCEPVEKSSIPEIANSILTHVGDNPTQLSKFFSTLFQNKKDEYLNLSGYTAGRLVKTLGLTVNECRLSSSVFESRLTDFFNEKKNFPIFITERPKGDEVIDRYTLSNYQKVPVKHLEMNLRFDFDHHQIEGKITYTLQKQMEDQLLLDTEGLEILEVSIKTKDGGESSAPFRLSDPTPYLGRALIIPLPAEIKTDQVTVRYKTDSKKQVAALQWMTPQQTDSGKPFFFNQPDFYHLRGMIPLQDTPAAPVTVDWNFLIEKKLGLRVVASNDQLHQGIPAPHEATDKKYEVWSYRLEKPTSPHLLGVAIGALKPQVLMDRTILYSEPHEMKKAKKDYQSFRQLLQKAESLFGPLPDRSLDTVIMPHSYPFTGVEYRGLNFIGSFLVAGDGFGIQGEGLEINIVPHELMHSWFENFIRLEDIWLVEGLTVYAGETVSEAFWGRKYSETTSVLMQNSLDKRILKLGESQKSCLATKIRVENPEDGFDTFLYFKGYLFAKWLENRLGKDQFIGFLKDTFTQKTESALITTEDFISLLLEKSPSGKITRTELEEWVYSPGLPEETPKIESSQLKKALEIIKNMLQKNDLTEFKKEWKSWDTSTKIYFLKQLHNKKNLPQNILDFLKIQPELQKGGKVEMLTAWYQLVGINQYQELYPELEDFLVHDNRVGTTKHVGLIFWGLKKGKELKLARKIYSKIKPSLHTLTQDYLNELLEVQ